MKNSIIILFLLFSSTIVFGKKKIMSRNLNSKKILLIMEGLINTQTEQEYLSLPMLEKAL